MAKMNEDDLKAHAADVDAFLGKLREFLMDANKPNGEWPDLSYDDMNALHNMTENMVELKWGRDCDSDLPVRINLLDRRKEYLPWDMALRHDPRNDEHPSKTEARLLRNIDLCGSAIRSYSEHIGYLGRRLQDLHNDRLRAAAAQMYVVVTYKTQEAEPQTMASIHSDELHAYAAALHPTPGLVSESISIYKSTPGRSANHEGGFAEHFKAVEDSFDAEAEKKFNLLRRLGLSFESNIVDYRKKRAKPGV